MKSQSVVPVFCPVDPSSLPAFTRSVTFFYCELLAKLTADYSSYSSVVASVENTTLLMTEIATITAIYTDCSLAARKIYTLYYFTADQRCVCVGVYSTLHQRLRTNTRM